MLDSYNSVTTAKAQIISKSQKMENSHYTGGYPIQDVSSKLGDRWTTLTMVTLKTNGMIRSCDIQKMTGDVPQCMPTVTPRSLETDGLIIRDVYAKVPPRMEHSLMETGHDLIPHMELLVGWTLEHMAGILKRWGVQQEVGR